MIAENQQLICDSKPFCLCVGEVNEWDECCCTGNVVGCSEEVCEHCGAELIVVEDDAGGPTQIATGVQPGLFDSCLTDYVRQCLQAGARIVKKEKSTVGMVLCPTCNSEKDLRHVYDGKDFAGYACKCGHRFTRDEAAILAFPTH